MRRYRSERGVKNTDIFRRRRRVVVRRLKKMMRAVVPLPASCLQRHLYVPVLQSHPLPRVRFPHQADAKNRKGPRKGPFLFLVEAAGIEPASVSDPPSDLHA